MMLPGTDMIRLFFVRLINNKSPFHGDNNHIHHLLIKKLKHTKAIIIIFLLIFIPIFLFHFLKINPLLLIISFFIMYLTILKICSNKIFKKNYKL